MTYSAPSDGLDSHQKSPTEIANKHRKLLPEKLQQIGACDACSLSAIGKAGLDRNA
jgi:hypothetical protein